MRYSYSRLSALSQCSAKYAWRYIDKWYTDSAGIEAFVGTVVHEVIEEDHKETLQGVEPWELYSELWDKKSKGKTLVDVRNRGIEHWKSYGSKCIDNYLQMGRSPLQVLGVEKRFTSTIGEDDILGIVDRVVMRDPPGGIVIEDFKTGKKPDKKYFLADHQLPLYAELARREYNIPPDAEIMTARIYLATGKREVLPTDQERRDKAWAWAEAGIAKDKAFRAQFAKDRDVEFDDGPLCRWCDYNAHCPIFSPPKQDRERAATLI